MNIGTRKDFAGKANRHSSLRKSLAVAGILGGLFLASCGGGTNGSVGGVSAGVYSSGASGGATALSAATITGASTQTPTINATLYVQPNGDLTLVDLTNEIICTGKGTTSGSTITGTLDCSGQKVSYTNVSFTGTLNGSSISGSYTIQGESPQNFTIGESTVSSQSTIPIDNTTFTVPTSGCANSSTSGMGVYNGEMVMCPTGGSGSSGSNITIGSSGTITGGYLNFTMPSVPTQTIATNCTLQITGGSQTITITGGTLTALAGLANVYSVTNMTGTMGFTIQMTIAGTGCSTVGMTPGTTIFSNSGQDFTMTTGTASVVDMNATNVLVLGGSVSVPASGSQSAQTFSVPNTAL